MRPRDPVALLWLLIAAFALTGLVVGEPWCYVLFGLAGLLALAPISEELFAILALGLSTSAVLGIVGVPPELSLTIFGLGLGAAVTLLTLLAIAAGVSDIATRLRRRGIARGDAASDGSRQRGGSLRSWKFGREMLRSPSQYVVTAALRQLPPEMSDVERRRWEEEMRSDVANVQWALPRLFYAFGIWRRGAATMPAESEQAPRSAGD